MPRPLPATAIQVLTMAGIPKSEIVDAWKTSTPQSDGRIPVYASGRSYPRSFVQARSFRRNLTGNSKAQGPSQRVEIRVVLHGIDRAIIEGNGPVDCRNYPS